MDVELFRRAGARVPDPDRVAGPTGIVALGPLPRRLVRVLSWFAADGVPVEILHRLDDAGQQEVDAALEQLATHALVTRCGDVVSMDRLVQAAVRAQPDEVNGGRPAAARRLGRSLFRKSPPAPPTSREVAARLLLRALPAQEDPASRSSWRRLLPHLEAVAGDDRTDGADLLQIRAAIAMHLYEQGMPSRALPLLEAVLTDRTRVLGTGHDDTLASQTNLAVAYAAAGRTSDAIALYEINLAARERRDSRENLDYTVALSALAGAYTDAGDVDAAVPLYETALATRTRLQGEHHPDTVAVAHHLAEAVARAGAVRSALVPRPRGPVSGEVKSGRG